MDQSRQVQGMGSHGAVMPTARHPGEVIPLLGIKLMSIKTKLYHVDL